MVNDKYSILAGIYDFFFKEEEASKVFECQKTEIIKMLSTDLTENLDILEVGAGTGRMTQYLTTLGNVTALDSSFEMLSILDEKKASFKRCPKLVEADFLEFESNDKYDVIIMCLDVFNYFDHSEIDEVLQKAEQLLKSGGVFVFDFSSYYKLSKVLGDNIIAQDFDDFAFIWENTFNENMNYLNFDFIVFEKRQDGLYQKTVETHCQTAHQLDDVLKKAEKYFTDSKVFIDKSSDSYDIANFHVKSDQKADRYYIYLKKGG